jgi:hypothetical protein
VLHMPLSALPHAQTLASRPPRVEALTLATFAAARNLQTGGRAS